MYSRIVVGTDGSGTASGAVAVAADLARRSGAVVYLVNAYQLSPGAMGVPMGGLIVDDAGLGGTELEEQAGEILATTAQSLLGDVTVEHHVGRGPAADVIVAVADAVEADLIVVGSKGMNRRILGSIPNSVAHNAPVCGPDRQDHLTEPITKPAGTSLLRTRAAGGCRRRTPRA